MYSENLLFKIYFIVFFFFFKKLLLAIQKSNRAFYIFIFLDYQ